MIKSLTSAKMVSSWLEYPWMLNKLMLMENPCFGSTFVWGKERTLAARSQRVWKLRDLWLLILRMEATATRVIFHIHILLFEVSFLTSKKKSSVAFLVEKSMSYFWMINVTTEFWEKLLKKYIFHWLAWNIVATIAKYLMVLFSSLLGNSILVDYLLNKLFYTKT